MVAILVDVTRCTGCERCVTACVAANELDPRLAERDRTVARDGLSANRLLHIAQVADGRFARRSCLHCVEPSCVSACLVGGMTKTPEGPVVYDPDKCIGCRYCMLACPFHIPRYEWDEKLPFVTKCMMCVGRLQDGGVPACVEACPHDVLTFGEREELLRQARTRLHRQPALYQNHIWGEHEFGGTSVLYISDVDLCALGWPEQPTTPIPALTEPLIHSTPFIGLTVAAGLLGVNWVVKRRMKLAEEGQDSHEQPPTSTPGGAP